MTYGKISRIDLERNLHNLFQKFCMKWFFFFILWAFLNGYVLFLIIDFCTLKGVKQVFVNLHRFDMGPNPARFHFPAVFFTCCCGSDPDPQRSALICLSWIKIRICDADPDLGAWKLTELLNKASELH